MIEQTLDMVRRDEPFFVSLSPPCTKCCALLRLCQHPVDRREWIKAVRMVNVAVKMAEIQLNAGRHFLFEHPLTAASWRLPSLRRLRQRAGVCECHFHMCAYGLTSTANGVIGPARKATRVLTSSTAIRDQLQRRCPGDHQHIQIISGRPAAAQEYPEFLCEAVIHGVEMEMVQNALSFVNGDFVKTKRAVEPHENMMTNLHEYGVEWVREGDDGHEPVAPAAGYEDASGDGPCDGRFQPLYGNYIDDVTGKPLKEIMVQQGRKEELQGFEQQSVYDVRSRQWAESQGIPIFGPRWVNRLKNGAVRSRLCVQEINRNKGKAGPDELFAPTPPLVAARYATSRCASSSHLPAAERRRLMAIDFEKAFLNGNMQRPVCIRLPPEDGRGEGGRYVGFLNKAMYGLRDAPAIWQGVVRDLMSELGFSAIPTMPCVYYHKEHDIMIVAHVDDFLAVGNKAALKELKVQLRERYDCDGDILGPDQDEKQEIKFLGRRIKWTDGGLVWCSDPKQVEAFIIRAGLDEKRSASETPGVKHEKMDHEELMEEKDVTHHRGLCALANYISQDRPDLGYAALDLSTTMAKPKVSDSQGPKRLARYLCKYPVCELHYKWQKEPAQLQGFSDSDWGSDPHTRRSVSGGVVMHGTHLLTFWARKQMTIALSSCEAEINALNKLGQEALGVKYLLEQMGASVGLRLHTDASAAVGVVNRQCSGKQKHLEIRQLWAQEKMAAGVFSVHKLPRAENASDLLTHHWSATEGRKFLEMMSVQRPAANKVAQGEGA